MMVPPDGHDRGALLSALLMPRGAADGWVVDELRDAWRGAAAEVDATYARWTAAGRGGRGDAFAVYRAAVERETHACGAWDAFATRRRSAA